MKQLRKREAAERRAAAESQMDANLIPLGERPVCSRHEAGSCSSNAGAAFLSALADVAAGTFSLHAGHATFPTSAVLSSHRRVWRPRIYFYSLRPVA